MTELNAIPKSGSPATQAKKKFVEVFERDNPGVRHVREILPGENARDVQMRPTEYEAKMARIAKETDQVQSFPDWEDVMAFAEGPLHPEIKATVPKVRFPLEKYHYAKRRMAMDARPLEDVVKAVQRIEREGKPVLKKETVFDGRPKEEDLRPMNVCTNPGCNFTGKRIDIHMKHCKFKQTPQSA